MKNKVRFVLFASALLSTFGGSGGSGSRTGGSTGGPGRTGGSTGGPGRAGGPGLQAGRAGGPGLVNVPITRAGRRPRNVRVQAPARQADSSGQLRGAARANSRQAVMPAPGFGAQRSFSSLGGGGLMPAMRGAFMARLFGHAISGTNPKSLRYLGPMPVTVKASGFLLSAEGHATGRPGQENVQACAGISALIGVLLLYDEQGEQGDGMMRVDVSRAPFQVTQAVFDGLALIDTLYPGVLSFGVEGPLCLHLNHARKRVESALSQQNSSVT